MWLIVLGIALILISAFAYLTQGNQASLMVATHNRPTPSPTTLPLLAAGVILCGAAFYFFYYASSQDAWHAISFVLFAVVLFMGGVYCFKGAYRADLKYAEDMKARAEAHSQRVAFEQSQVSLENVREESQMEAMMRRMKQELEMLRIEVEKRMIPLQEQTAFMHQFIEQREMALRAQYVKPASEQGVSVDQYMAINEHWNRQLIDLEIKQRAFQNIDQNALESEDTIVRQKVNQKLLKYAQDLIQERQELYKSNLPIDEKKVRLDLYAINIMGLVNELSERGVIDLDGQEKLHKFLTNHNDMEGDSDSITASRKRWDFGTAESVLKYGRT